MDHYKNNENRKPTNKGSFLTAERRPGCSESDDLQGHARELLNQAILKQPENDRPWASELIYRGSKDSALILDRPGSRGSSMVEVQQPDYCGYKAGETQRCWWSDFNIDTSRLSSQLFEANLPGECPSSLAPINSLSDDIEISNSTPEDVAELLWDDPPSGFHRSTDLTAAAVPSTATMSDRFNLLNSNKTRPYEFRSTPTPAIPAQIVKDIVKGKVIPPGPRIIHQQAKRHQPRSVPQQVQRPLHNKSQSRGLSLGIPSPLQALQQRIKMQHLDLSRAKGVPPPIPASFLKPSRLEVTNKSCLSPKTLKNLMPSKPPGTAELIEDIDNIDYQYVADSGGVYKNDLQQPRKKTRGWCCNSMPW